MPGQLPMDDGRSGHVIILHPLLDTVPAARPGEAALEEAAGLAMAIGLDIVHMETVNLGRPTAPTLLGRGTVDRIAAMVQEARERHEEVDVVFINHPLSPVQQRNLERMWGTKVIDRTALILEIFGARARTREGQLQVELASLSYQRSRLVRSWTHLGRQRGGFGFLGGPGESQLESDRRLISGRIDRLTERLAELRRTRGLHRQGRRRANTPVIALVGYTNAGKSTLFNRLSGANVVARDQLFATLDPTMRAVQLPSGRRVILSDTVGFISDLPHHLVDAFRATLEEVQEADLILHVRDIAHPDTEAQKADVEGILRDLGIDPAADRRLMEVINKIDLCSSYMLGDLLEGTAGSERRVAVSALTGQGIDALLARLDRFFRARLPVTDLSVDLTDGEALALIQSRGEILKREDRDGRAHLSAALDAATLARLAQRATVTMAPQRTAGTRQVRRPEPQLPHMQAQRPGA